MNYNRNNVDNKYRRELQVTTLNDVVEKQKFIQLHHNELE